MKGLAWVRGGILLLLFCLCIAMSLSWSGRDVNNGSVTLYLPEGTQSFDALTASEARTAEPVPFALWRQQEGVVIKNTEFGRSLPVGVMTVFGDSTVPLPSLPMLLPDSGLACLLDSNSSYELFGDANAVGGKLMLDGRQYTVVGVFPWSTGMVVRQGRDNEDVRCDRISLGLTGAAGKTQAAEEFAMRHGLSPYATAQLGFRIDRASLVPSRWSDFEFWGTAAAEVKEQLWRGLTLPKELPQAIPMLIMLHSGAWGIAGAIALVLLVLSCRSIIKGAAKKKTVK